jgi:hypothetical protein
VDNRGNMVSEHRGTWMPELRCQADRLVGIFSRNSEIPRQPLRHSAHLMAANDRIVRAIPPLGQLVPANNQIAAAADDARRFRGSAVLRKNLVCRRVTLTLNG